MVPAYVTSVGRRIVRIAMIIAVLYLAAGTYLYVFQRNFVFVPSGTLAQPSERGLDDVKVIELVADDGIELTAWSADALDGKPTILYFHGNGGNISSRSKRFGMILNSGFGLFALSYRGYAGSGGSPSEAALVADGLLAFDQLKAQEIPIVVYGESLGTAVAVAVAAERDAAALVLEAPFSAAVDLARDRYGWLPVEILMKDPFRSRDRIGGVKEPVLIVHGEEDRIVPIAQGRDLFSRANEPKEMIVMDGAHHGDLWIKGLWPVVTDFLQDQMKTGT